MRKENFRDLLRSMVLPFIVIWVNVHAQDPSFSVMVSTEKVLQNSDFEIRFELRNANGDMFQPPDFHDFQIARGPMVGSSTMIINGKVTRSQTWTYILMAPKAGTFTLESAVVIAGQRKLKSNPVTIHVTAAKDFPGQGATGNEAIQLIAYVKDDEYFPGQQIVLEYKLLFTQNVQTANTLSEDDYSDFFVQSFNSFSKEPTYETINGVTYTSRIIKAVALFAHQSGTFQIDPLIMDVGINAPYPGNQGFFTMRRLQNVRVASAPLAILLLPLPVDPMPSGFSGAVGEYSLITLTDGPTQISTDDDFGFKIQIRGNGDARRWDPPSIVTDGEFEIYDPNIPEDQMKDEGGLVMHSRTIEYVLIPKQPGEYKIYVPFRYFNTAVKKYETIYSDTISLHVVQGQNVPRHARIDTAGTSVTLPLKKVNNIKINDRFWLSIPHLFLFGLVMTGTFLGFWITYRRRKEALVPYGERMRSVASQQARHQLDLLSNATEMSDKVFSEKATEVYSRFLSEKFNIPPADLDEDKIQSYFLKEGMPDDLIERTLRFFNLCLSVRYGGIPGGYTREEMIGETRSIIDALDTAARYHI